MTILGISAGVAFALVVGFAGSMTWAVPPDPERPFRATTCAEALDRLAEAQRGSPLIPAARMRAITDLAAAQAALLCGPAMPSQGPAPAQLSND